MVLNEVSLCGGHHMSKSIYVTICAFPTSYTSVLKVVRREACLKYYHYW